MTLDPNVKKLTQYHESNSKLIMHSGDRTPNRSLVEGIAEHMRTAYVPCVAEAAQSDLKTTLLNMNSDCHDGVVQPLETLKASAKSLKTQSAWEAKLNEEEQKAKANADAAITKGFNRVRATVSTLPKDQQIHAVDLFSKGEKLVTNWVGNITDLFGGILHVVESVVDDVEKVAEGVVHAVSDGVEHAVGEVSSIAGKAADAIVSLF